MSPPTRRLLPIAGLLVVLAALIAAACDRAAPAMAAANPDPRVIALSPALASTLRHIGSGRLLVGRHGFDAGSDPSIPSCGDQAGIDYEMMLRLAPTDILIERSAAGTPARLVHLATAGGWRIHTYPLLGLDELEAAAVDLAQRFPGTVSPEALRADLRRAWSKREPPLSRAGRVLMLTGVTPKVYALGPGSWHHQILERLGGMPAITRGEPYVTMDVEDVLRLAPDVIIVLAPRAHGAPSSAGLVRDAAHRAEALGPLSKLAIPAVTSGRIGIIDDPECLLPSTSMIRVADDLAAMLGELGESPGADGGGKR